MKPRAGTTWSDSAGFARASTSSFSAEHKQAPRGPKREEMKCEKKKKKYKKGWGEWKQLPPTKKRKEKKKNKKKNTSLVFYISLTQRQLRGQFMCERQKDTLTLSASVTDATDGCWRGVAAAKRPAPLVLICECVWERERLGDGWVFCVCVTWCLEAFMIMNGRSSPN